MIWIGVTGGIGCGKSTVIAFLKKQGFGVVSADQIVHDLYQSPVVVSEISKILNIDQKNFSKEKIAEAVFSDKEKLKALENYLHPLVRQETQKKKKAFEDSGDEMAFYEIPLLFEKNMQANFDKTVCVGAAPKIQLERIKKRNPWSDEEINQRLSSQMPLEQKKELADFYIDNSTDLKSLEKSCLDLIDTLKENV
jgi:dephospho-CoA kinase